MHDQFVTDFLGRARSGLIGRHLLYYPSLKSTMDQAKNVVRKGSVEGTVIIAGEQTAGRGRMGRTWVSPPGSSIYMSVILNPDLSQLAQMNMVASLATVRGIENVTGLKSGIKWPNDILIRGRKVSGILIENVFQGHQLKAAIVGIGINVNLDTGAIPEISSIATSLAIETGHEVSASETLTSVLDALEVVYGDLRAGRDVYHKWLPLVETIGKSVRVKYGETIVQGLAESVDAGGRLILRKSDGTPLTLVAGEVTFQTG